MRRNTSMKPETLHSGLRHRSHRQPNHAGRGRAHALCARAMGYCSLPCKRGGPRGRPGRVAAWACAQPCASFSSKKVDETGAAHKTVAARSDFLLLFYLLLPLFFGQTQFAV